MTREFFCNKLLVKRLTVNRLIFFDGVIFTAENREITKRILDIGLLRRIKLRKTLCDSELHLGQLPIIEFIMKNDSCTQCEIAQELKVSPASIALSTKRLQNAGIIKKKTDKSNMRKNMLSVTEKGVALAEKYFAAFDEVNGLSYVGLSDEEKNTLCTLLDKVILNLNENKPFSPDKFEAFKLRNELEESRGDKK